VVAAIACPCRLPAEPAVTARGLEVLAGWAELRLGNEHVDPQAVLEQVVADLRMLAARAANRAAVTLGGAQLDQVVDALHDAAELRREAAGSYCVECRESPVELCADHEDCLNRADTYDRLASELQQEEARR